MRIPAFLLLLLISVLWESGAYGRGSLSTWPHANHPNQAAQAEACTLDVVLVTFLNETTATAGANCLYCNHDRPHGSNDNGTYPDPDSSYTLREFERLFSGGYGSLQDSALVGNTVKVAKGNHKLPKVFGSVRA